jgi:hypothetical protein
MGNNDRKEYNKTYYDEHKNKIIKQVVDRQKLIRNSDKYIEDTRDKLVDDLNNGVRKFIHFKTLLKYKINIDPKTLKYYYNSEAKTPEVGSPRKGTPSLGLPEASSSEDERQEQHNKEELYEQEEQVQHNKENLYEQEEQEQHNKEELYEPLEQAKQEQEESESASHTEPSTPKHDNGEANFLTVDVLKAMLEQDAINEDDMNKIITFPQNKRNKKKRTLIRRLRDKFKF